MTNLDFTNFIEAIGKNNWNPEKGGIYDYFIANPPVDEDGNRKGGTSYQVRTGLVLIFPFALQEEILVVMLVWHGKLGGTLRKI